MMKKKSMAVAMAAVTVAIPATQSFAAVVDNTQTEQIKEMKAKALKLMNLKYTKDANLLNKSDIDDKNVFTVKLTTPGSAVADTCTSYAEFERKFDKAYAKLEDGQSVKIGYEYAQAVGYSTLEDGQVVDFKLEKYTQADLQGLPVGDAVGQIKVTELGSDGSKKYEVRLSDDKNGLRRYKEVKAGDVKLNFDKPVVKQEKDYYVDIDGNSIASVEDGDEVAFAAGDKTVVNVTRKDKTVVALKNAQIEGFYADTTKAAEMPEITKDVITKQGTQNLTVNSTDLFNVSEGRVTAQGNDLVRQLNEYKSNLYDVNYRVVKEETSIDKEMTIKVYRTDVGSSDEGKIAEIKIVRDEKDNKAEAYRAIKDIIENANYADRTRVAAGADRYETAAEVSRMQFADNAFNGLGEKAVVLVTGAQDKLVDGLTATPLAASLNGAVGAPVLLTGNDKIAKPVLDEIERLGANKVYIVGGAISESVEKELKDVHGLNVDRVDGDDRYETSMEVADKIAEIRTDANKADKVFVVGGKGEADALSVASIAAKEKAPILLTSKDKLSKDVKYFIEKKTTAASEAYVIGGTSSVSTDVYNDVLDVVGAKSRIARLSGDNRQDTNAKVANKFFVGADKVVVAKSDNKGMVDALGAGLYAGKNNAPLILATNNLTEDQEDYLNDTAAVTTASNHKVIVGNGVSSTIAKFIKNLK